MMEVKILKESKNEIEFEVIGEKTLLNPLKNKLLEYENVEFAEWKIEHPLISNPTFYLRVKKDGVRETLKKAIDELKAELSELIKQMEEQG